MTQAIAALGSTLLKGFGVTASAGAATGFNVAGSLLGGVSAVMSGAYQSAIMRQQAEIATQNAQQAREVGALTAQEQDFAALSAISEETARQSASGFSLDSASFFLRRRRNLDNATLNRNRTVEAHETTARNYENEANVSLAEAKSARSAGRLKLFSSFINVGSDLISGAELLNSDTRRRINRNTRNVASG